jgi:omega-amidase
MQALNIIGLQWDLAWENPEANRQKAANMLAEQDTAGALIVLPEMFTTGFSMDAPANAENMEGPSLKWMQELASQQQALVTGSLIIEEDGHYYNRFLAVSSAGLVCQYDKRHTFRMAGEHEVYQPGQHRAIFSWQGWRICPQVCYDLRFPVWSRAHSLGTGPDYDLLLYVANWPEPRISHWDALLKARAIENQTYVVGINRIGTDGNEVPYVGSSAIIDYLGKPVIHHRHTETLLKATLEPAPLQSYRQKFPVWKDADIFEIVETRG